MPLRPRRFRPAELSIGRYARVALATAPVYDAALGTCSNRG